MANADYGRRLSETRKRMSDAGLDGLLVSNPSNRRYLTGFTPKDAKYYGSEHAENQAGALSLMPVNLGQPLLTPLDFSGRV